MYISEFPNWGDFTKVYEDSFVVTTCFPFCPLFFINFLCSAFLFLAKCPHLFTPCNEVFRQKSFSYASSRSVVLPNTNAKCLHFLGWHLHNCWTPRWWSSTGDLVQDAGFGKLDEDSFPISNTSIWGTSYNCHLTYVVSMACNMSWKVYVYTYIFLRKILEVQRAQYSTTFII